MQMLTQTQALNSEEQIQQLTNAIRNAWKKIAPFWPMQNLVATNPLRGFEDMPFERALDEAQLLFQQKSLPTPLKEINRQTVKWCLAFFDQGQAALPAPVNRNKLFIEWKQLACFDKQLIKNDRSMKKWIGQLPDSPLDAILQIVMELGIDKQQQELFYTLTLSSLPGWAAHIKYLSEWSHPTEFLIDYELQLDYLAIRMVLTRIFWPDAIKLIDWYTTNKKEQKGNTDLISDMIEKEKTFRLPLLQKLSHPRSSNNLKQPLAQFVFCIDVRSEPIRREIEAVGPYQTFGFAGFFGLPIEFKNASDNSSFPSCPVLLKPLYSVKALTPQLEGLISHELAQLIPSMIHSAKYTMISPFGLMELLGPFAGAWMALKTCFPTFAKKWASLFSKTDQLAITDSFHIDEISFFNQCNYAQSALQAIGLTHSFAPMVVFCGHGSTTWNNAYASALDCGACGGRCGYPNARILAQILNDKSVRSELAKRGIKIPVETTFVGGNHETTADQIILDTKHIDLLSPTNKQVLRDLSTASMRNQEKRKINLALPSWFNKIGSPFARGCDWAQVRPEWGLAKNAAFLIGPRDWTKELDLEGRAFLHSYEWEQDKDGSILNTIINAPVIVAQWINAQYLFSTIDNVSFGGGCKSTKNIAGKMGAMQGNKSDLMHGLPMQSVFSSDEKPYHEPIRLMTVVYAPQEKIMQIILASPHVKQLIQNEWITFAYIDPQSEKAYICEKDLSWSAAIKG